MRSESVVTVSIVTALMFASGAMAQDHPGQIPNPSTYAGSMEQQRRDAASAAQVQAQNQQMLQRLDDDYAAYAPKGGGVGGGGGGADVLTRLKARPLLPAAKNPLIGRWRQMPGKPVELGLVGALPGAAEVVNGAFGGACESVFGKGTISFTPTAFNWVAPDGHEEILNRVEYRSNGADVIVIPLTPDPVPFIFGLPDKDHAVAAFFGCTMERAPASGKPLVAAPATSAAASPSPSPSPSSASAILNMTVGEMVSGSLSSPPAGTRIHVTSQDPDANLAKAGFAGDASGPPIEKLFAACKISQGGSQDSCTRALAALTSGAVASVATDMNGQAQAGALVPGRYYVVGFTPYKGHLLIWHMPVDLKPGVNAVTLSPQNGSVSR